MKCRLPGKIYFLALLFLSYLHMALGANDSIHLEQDQSVNGVNQSGPCESNTKASSTISDADSSKTPQPAILVTQTPAAATVMEGSTLRMECSFQINGTRLWYLEWFKIGRKDKLTNSSRMSIITSKEGFSHLILSKTEIADSGTYTCKLGGEKLEPSPHNGTRLTVNGITSLMVNQTPEHINQGEGSNFTIECQFRTVSDYNATEVRWYRNKTKLNSAGDSLRIELDLERGFSSLTLTNATVRDSGDYICQAENRPRNLTGSRKTSRVTITTTPQSIEQKTQPGMSLTTIGAWAGTGVAILLLVVASVILWRCRSKGILASRSELETSPAKEIGLHPSLISQGSEVTYADLQFNKKEVRPDAEVVYAEVKTAQKQQAGQGAKHLRPAGNQRR